jgi:superfamily II DNA/RNA helicase
MIEEEKTSVLTENNTQVATTENLVSTKKEWEDLSIPAEIMKGLKDGAGWERPSKI